jgi:hypothetical protein
MTYPRYMTASLPSAKALRTAVDVESHRSCRNHTGACAGVVTVRISGAKVSAHAMALQQLHSDARSAGCDLAWQHRALAQLFQRASSVTYGRASNERPNDRLGIRISGALSRPRSQMTSTAGGFAQAVKNAKSTPRRLALGVLVRVLSRDSN